ncbi:hypothetical protein [Tsuneonella deserti]|uniref:hypothetical protein n=1 Tax=Tsuneonella deserti TaxID=2035528 RepID=UPI00166E8FED|nr:hypothetical protein [Tsuneonella deserti]
MKVIVDSSSVINLFNADALKLFCRLARCEFLIPPLVFGECAPSCASSLLELRDEGCVEFLNDTEIDADRYLELLGRYSLGAGETECIAASVDNDFRVCCDDRKAREAAAEMIGQDRVLGTVRLLRWCVEDEIADCGEAFRLFGEMKGKGGFLPNTPQAFFCAGDREGA